MKGPDGIPYAVTLKRKNDTPAILVAADSGMVSGLVPIDNPTDTEMYRSSPATDELARAHQPGLQKCFRTSLPQLVYK